MAVPLPRFSYRERIMSRALTPSPWFSGVIGLLLWPLDATAAVTPLSSGEIGLKFSLSQAGYVSRHFALDGNATRVLSNGEISGELHASKEYIRLENQPSEVNLNIYDANLKWLSLMKDPAGYFYVSPRIRHNRESYYQSAVALRLGVGRKLNPSPKFAMRVELGSGYREVSVRDGSELTEPLVTLTGKVNWTVSDSVGARFEMVEEQTRRETYRTIQTSIRNKLTDQFALKYELSYKRGYPFDANPGTNETTADVGLTYSF